MISTSFYKQAKILALLTLVVQIASIIVPLVIFTSSSGNWPSSNLDEDFDVVVIIHMSVIKTRLTQIQPI